MARTARQESNCSNRPSIQTSSGPGGRVESRPAGWTTRPARRTLAAETGHRNIIFFRLPRYMRVGKCQDHRRGRHIRARGARDRLPRLSADPGLHASQGKNHAHHALVVPVLLMAGGGSVCGRPGFRAERTDCVLRAEPTRALHGSARTGVSKGFRHPPAPRSRTSTPPAPYALQYLVRFFEPWAHVLRRASW